MKKKIVIGVTGASGSIYARKLIERLEALNDQVEETAVIFSKNAGDVWKYELPDAPFPPEGKIKIYRPDDFFAPMASGSSGYQVMIICPCTMGTLGRIAAGISSDLMTRAADVMLKERRRLILVPRETPYNLIHLNNMKLLTEAGAIICPATPSFYSRPQNVEDLVLTVVDRILDLAGFDLKTYRWGTA